VRFDALLDKLGPLSRFFSRAVGFGGLPGVTSLLRSGTVLGSGIERIVFMSWSST
jgi:hypothetical protein